MVKRYKVALIGFGNIAQGYTLDSAMNRYYPYSTHAQVLKDHPSLDWQMVVDISKKATDVAINKWNVPLVFNSLNEIKDHAKSITILIISTPPNYRINVIDHFPNLKAVIVEKPLGIDYESAIKFLEICEKRNILVQVNLWRRADKLFRGFSNGAIHQSIGNIQSAICFYGNGIRNNGIHMIDFASQLFGKIKRVENINIVSSYNEGPIKDDKNIAFNLVLERAPLVTFHPLSFKFYRENGLIIYGDKGRLDILNEGLIINSYKVENNRSTSGEYEIAIDNPKKHKSTVGNALYELYVNLIDCIEDKAKIFSSGKSAMHTTTVLEEIYNYDNNIKSTFVK